MKTRTVFAIILATSTAAFAGPNETARKIQDTEARIVAHVHAVDQLEIELGKLAEANGTASVKAYGRMLVKDHTAFDTKLVSYASERGMTVIPEDTMQSDAERTDINTEKGKLETLKGNAFDRDFLPFMQKAHDAEIDRLDKGIGDVHDGELKTMLKSLKPQLQHHADEAKRLERGIETSQR